MTSTESTPFSVKHYNPVDVRADNTLGVIILGIIAIGLLIALLRSQAQLRTLLSQNQAA